MPVVGPSIKKAYEVRFCSLKLKSTSLIKRNEIDQELLEDPAFDLYYFLNPPFIPWQNALLNKPEHLTGPLYAGTPRLDIPHTPGHHCTNLLGYRTYNLRNKLHRTFTTEDTNWQILPIGSVPTKKNSFPSDGPTPINKTAKHITYRFRTRLLLLITLLIRSPHLRLRTLMLKQVFFVG